MLGSDIVSGSAKHWTTDWGTENLDLAGLANGDTSLTTAFKTSTSDTDRWAFSVQCDDGSSYSVDEKDCGFEHSDMGGTVTLQAVVANGSRTLQIIMPESSNCSCSF